MLPLAGPSLPKRVASHDVYSTYNDHGEWSIRVEPGGLQIDNYHSRGASVHMHRSGRYNPQLDLPPITESTAAAIIVRHLVANRGIKIDTLLQEFGNP